MSATPLPYARCFFVPASDDIRRVRLVLQPLDPSVRPDSVLFDRARPAANPLNTP